MKFTSQLPPWSGVKPVNTEVGGGGRRRRRKDKQVLNYLGQSNRGVVMDGRCGSRSGPGLPEGHVKVECGWAGCLPEAVISQESLFFLSENCMPPGRDYSSLFQYSPGYLNNWFWKHVTKSCHKAGIYFFFFFFDGVLFRRNSTDVTRDRASARCITGQTITRQLLRSFWDRGEWITQQAADSVS